MKIVHICLSGSYNDGWQYHDNMLSEFHAYLGHKVTLIASPFCNDKASGKYQFYKVGTYYNVKGIKIIRLSQLFSNKLKVITKLRLYKNLYKNLENEKPDIIFIHCCQFLDIYKVIKYVKNHRNIKLFVDNHADFENSAQTWVSYNIMHRIIWGYGARKIEPYTSVFYGVLPARVKFLQNVYGISPKKLQLLVMGADDRLRDIVMKDNSKELIRKKYNIKKEDFLIVTGGKIGKDKVDIIYLMRAVCKLKQQKIKLIVFGGLIEEYKEIVYKLCNDRIFYVGWLDNQEVYEFFAASDLAFFPSKHSVYWEQAVGMGLPCVFRKMNGFQHIDLGGNCILLDKITEKSMQETIETLYNDKFLYNKMKATAMTKGIRRFSYFESAKKSIK